MKENKKYKIKKDKTFYGLITIMSLFIILTISVYLNWTNQIDSAVASFILGLRNDKLTHIMTLITNIGGSYCLICISIISIIRTRKPSFTIIINLVTVFLLSQLFKLIFHRGRPNDIFLTYANGYSYPSGHTMVSTAYFLVLSYLICQKIKNKTIKVFVNIISITLIILIGISRLYLGVHYLSDIIAGYLLAALYLIIAFKIFKDKEMKL